MEPYTIEAYKAGKKAVTRDGRRVTDLHYFADATKENQKFLGVLDSTIDSWSDNGEWAIDESIHDLFIAPEEITVKLDGNLTAIVGKDKEVQIKDLSGFHVVWLTFESIDKLAAAKKEVAQ